MAMSSVVIIGAGNVGYHLTMWMRQAKVPIIQVYNRSKAGLHKIRAIGDVSTTSTLAKLAPADIYIIAVSDDQISACAEQISPYITSQSIVTHTSGSVPLRILSPYFDHVGVFYPLQSFKKERQLDYNQIPIFLSGDEDVTQGLLSTSRVMSQSVHVISDEARSKLHVPAVMVNNFVNHMFTVAYDYCSDEGLEFSHLLPLIQETVDRLVDDGHPADLQTGPAVRGDSVTIRRHRKQLHDYPDLKRLYQYLSRHISTYHADR